MSSQFVTNPDNPDLKIRMIELLPNIGFLQVIGAVKDVVDISLANGLVKEKLDQITDNKKMAMLVDLTKLTYLPRIKDAVDQAKFLKTKKLAIMVFIMPKYNHVVKSGMEIIGQFAKRVFELELVFTNSPREAADKLKQKFKPDPGFWETTGSKKFFSKLEAEIAIE